MGIKESDHNSIGEQQQADPCAVSLEELSKMTGFPESLITDDLILEHAVEQGQVDMETLRGAMMGYLKRTASK